MVRRLLNCSLDLPTDEKQTILSKFAQKMPNSGHSVASTQLVLVHGVMKFNDIVRRSRLSTTHPGYQPIHFDKLFKRFERRLNKYLAKSGWYSTDSGGMVEKSNWRSDLPKEWQGSRPIQRKLHAVDYTTVMQVPSTDGGGF